MNDFGWEVLLETIKAAFSVGLLVAGWIFGGRIIAYWDDRKKRNEMDIAAAQRFFELYGEFKAIMRLWSTLSFHAKAGQMGYERLSFPPDDDSLRLELLRRSANAESGVEALILKLTAERTLSHEQLETLGLFRQAYQRLREAIRSDKELSWFSHTGAYALFNELAARVAHMISFDERPEIKLSLRGDDARAGRKRVDDALANLREVAGYGPEQFNERAEKTTPVRTKGGDAPARAERETAENI